jgi:NitT/TauT family transport system permease protein
MAGFTGGMGILIALLSLRPKTAESMQLFVDVTCVIHVFLIFYTLATAKLNLLRESMFPAPGQVLRQMAEDWSQILLNIGSSLGIILQGFTLGILIAVPIGLFFGSSARFSKAAGYIAGFLASIPPVVYIP